MTTVRPIIFSESMVLALLAGVKTQTRRLATSPLAKCVPGDVLYVREAFARCGPHAYEAMSLQRRIDAREAIIHRAGWHRSPPGGGWKPSIHMPRWGSRLALKITAVRFQPLLDISSADATAEGITREQGRYAHHGAWGDVRKLRDVDPAMVAAAPRIAFQKLWDSLHGSKPGEAWADNPPIVALSFEVLAGQVDDLQKRGVVA